MSRAGGGKRFVGHVVSCRIGDDVLEGYACALIEEPTLVIDLLDGTLVHLQTDGVAMMDDRAAANYWQERARRAEGRLRDLTNNKEPERALEG